MPISGTPEPPLFCPLFVERLTRGDVPLHEILEIALEACEVFAEEPSLLRLSSGLMVVGDVHGQFFDLLNIVGTKPSQKYLFLGDYVDRGANSLEVILLLLHTKIRHRDRVWMIRGNHESYRLSFAYGFYEECMRMHSTPAGWSALCEVFEYLPLAGVIDGKIFAVHGGIGPETALKNIAEVDRVGDVPLVGTISELLWSDPDTAVQEYEKNSRGAGYLFGEAQVDAFLREAGLEKIIRSHQLVDSGYKEDFEGRVITIWSAPNYCYRCMNKAAIAEVTAQGIEYFEVAKATEQRGKTKAPIYFI
ncbi:serine/threonine-protein phosphatase 4 catalytic subunit [Nematocida displodere]|uniref:Serine/threonine-protein phosphatase n=1 Tax=Nematocida displodere TaxID=1805483 RepID=A0A177EAH0_9MICR|nr:serine/threonine-protein phosphatase 4 catalytic subunit [Nematocida displodere]